ncbi:elements of external origin [Tropicimonas isoalkanivorans]|uniref:Elements of external origin n=1 Tax=Tropicimonas isoalkanivorans TaxID=441112 RepID=A0A1I1JA07_9RHOB|nr:elements of external origin [Tropicimonas isoalkanivorans]SFC44822.1 hypothetical protein SAMN04488094_10518 [Tropicimonas isoalkanivorans]
MGLSRRAYAAHRKERGLPGGSEKAVRNAIASGRIEVGPDGSIDPDRADAQWAMQTDPAKQRAEVAPTGEPEPAAKKPVPQAAIDAVQDTLRDAGEAAPEGDGGQVSYIRARMANEVLKAQTAKVRLQKMKGELVDRVRATTMVFDLARRERDAWINWPPRVSANMAAELDVEAHLMEQVLDRHIREHLAELAEIRIELR